MIIIIVKQIKGLSLLKVTNLFLKNFFWSQQLN